MTARPLTAAFILTFGYGLAGYAQTESAEPASTPTSEAKKPAEQEVPRPGSALALLRRPVDSVDWDETPFGEILDWVREQGDNGVNIVSRWRSLSEEAVDEETPVTLKMQNTSVAEVLNEAIDQVSPEGRVRYRAVGNKITISTSADFERKMELKVYNVTDVLFRIPDFQQEAPQIDLQNTGGNRGGGGGGGGGGGSRGGSGQGVFSGGQQGQGGQQQQENEQELIARLDRLRMVIQETVAPESWFENGGKGVIRVYNRSLIVSNTIEVHEQLAGWFSLDR